MTPRIIFTASVVRLGPMPRVRPSPLSRRRSRVSSTASNHSWVMRLQNGNCPRVWAKARYMLPPRRTAVVVAAVAVETTVGVKVATEAVPAIVVGVIRGPGRMFRSPRRLKIRRLPHPKVRRRRGEKTWPNRLRRARMQDVGITVVGAPARPTTATLRRDKVSSNLVNVNYLFIIGSYSFVYNVII